MPPAASNKRTRTSDPPSPSDLPSQPQPRPTKYVKGFEKTARSDIILESSQGFCFATCRIFLQANSQVFQDTLLAGTDDLSIKIDGLPVIKLEDRFSVVQRYLSFIHTPVVEPLPLYEPSSLDSLFKFCDKMDSPLVGRAASTRFFSSLLRTKSFQTCVDAFLLALIWSRYRTGDVVADCLRLMGSKGIEDEKVDMELSLHNEAGAKDVDKVSLGNWRPCNLVDMNVELLRRVAFEDVIEFSRVRDKVLMESGYSWAQAAKDFTVHGYP
ncbi:hypothetical protein BDY24DRAFT_122375 [Mrakia frigida]|uniref:uncharacterized protein n=1 Tax=Mrakia frigida TaxID=29902 RepID=UPI003FCBF644